MTGIHDPLLENRSISFTAMYLLQVTYISKRSEISEIDNSFVNCLNISETRSLLV